MDVVVGIDLGTTRCVVAHDTGGGAPVIIDVEGDGPWTPSVVHFDGGRWEVGAEAALMAAVDPDSVVIGIKREMGEATTLFFGGEEYGPEGISGIILRHLAEVAEAELGPGRVRAVITVPAYFGAAEREATRAAARIAGLDCLGLWSANCRRARPGWSTTWVAVLLMSPSSSSAVTDRRALSRSTAVAIWAVSTGMSALNSWSWSVGLRSRPTRRRRTIPIFWSRSAGVWKR